ncbi:MAG: acetyltransferase [Sulfurimonas sp.]|nr:MAG: acetyltransferase [Sulfurimonas sp.]
MTPILLIGGGGHCVSVIDVIEQEGRFEIGGIIDRPERIGSIVSGYEIIGSDADLTRLCKHYRHALITVGQIASPTLRISLFEQAKQFGFILPSIVSPRAYVSRHAYVAEGTVIMHDALINANASLGANCIVNTRALIEHDSIVEAHCHIATGAIINGGVTVKQGCFIGSGAVSKEGITIEAYRVIKAGSVVT